MTSTEKIKTTINYPMSNIQLELLKLYSTNLSSKDLNELKNILAEHFSQRVVTEADKIWDAKNYNQGTMNQWLNEQ